MNQTILITGASSGIGKAVARYFSEKEEELNSCKNILVTRLDVQDKESISKSIQEGIDCSVN